MSLILPNPQQEIDTIVAFLKQTFTDQNIKHTVIAVSGGIDSAVALTLLAKTLSALSIHPVLLPYNTQSMTDAETICTWNTIPKKQWTTINIGKTVDMIIETLQISTEDVVRRGNIMARVRMICVYDMAKKLHGLVCGTENKSEQYLGYFTRFGDAASDIEPIVHLYKTQVRQLAEYLDLPSSILEKPPTAGLWNGQTDEQQLGFSYELADQVIEQLIDDKKQSKDIVIDRVSQEEIQKVIQTIDTQAFKRNVPYTIE